MRTSMFARVLVVAAAATVLVALFGVASAMKPKKLEGSWVVTITEGEGTPDLPNWYRARVTFGPHGALVATITDPLLATGHGAWEKVGGHDFDVTIQLPQFDAAGAFTGTLHATATLEIDGSADEFTSDNYEFEFFDPDGAPTGFVGAGTAHGTRIEVDSQ